MRPFNDRAIHHLAVERYHAPPFPCCRVGGVNDALGMLHLQLGGRVQVVQQVNLARVDKRFAVKTQLFDMRGLFEETGFVIGIGIDGIERLDTCGAGRLKNGAARKQQFSAFRRTFGA